MTQAAYNMLYNKFTFQFREYINKSQQDNEGRMITRTSLNSPLKNVITEITIHAACWI